MNKPDTQTETVTRTEALTETVTTAACPVCEQRVDVDEFVPVAVGVDVEQTATCRYCAQALFGFEGEPDGLDDADTTDTTDTTADTVPRRYRVAARVGKLLSRLSAHRQKLVSLVVGLGTTAVVGHVAYTIVTEASAQLASQDVTQVGAPLELMGPLFTAVLIAAVIWLVGKMMVAGPRP